MGLADCFDCDDDAAYGLGDIIATEGDCKEGEANVAELRSFFASVGSPAKWQPAYDALVAAYDASESSWSRKIPFSPECGKIKALGVQAKNLAAQIAADVGKPAPAGVTAPEGAEGVVKTLAYVGGAVAIGLVVLELAKARR